MIDISIVIPCYNGEQFIKECLDSCLNQTFAASRYEIIVVNDSSTDNSLSLLKEYSNKYENVRVLTKEHSGEADTTNLGIYESNGKYIAIMHIDDVMYNDRLEYQYNILEQNNNIDILGCGFHYYDDLTKGFCPREINKITIEDMLKYNHVAHPTVMFRKSSINTLPFLYEQYYFPSADYKFWFTCLFHNLTIYNYPKRVIKYRRHDNQASKTQLNKVKIQNNRIYNIYNHTPDNPEITVIIPFRNENVEVERTVQSILATSNKTKILLIDDSSNDAFDYNALAYLYNIDYIRLEKRKGVAQCRNIGVDLSTTKYCLLLDAHMRFYEDNWDISLIDKLENNPNSIICSNTVVIHKSENNIYYNEDGIKRITTYGASVNLDYTKERCFKHAWNYKKINAQNNLIKIPSVLGAAYAFNKKWWNEIHGLNGLITFGLDEALMSIKSWMFGGNCYLKNDWFVGHIYRQKQPYSVNEYDVAWNEFYQILLFVSEKEQNLYLNNLWKRISPITKEKIINNYDIYEKDNIEKEKHYIDNNKQISFEYFRDNINVI